MPSQGPVFYGWWMVVLSLILGSLGAGLTYYSASLLADALQREFSASRALIMLGITSHNLMVGLLAPKLATMMERISVRAVLSGGAFFSGLGYWFISFIPDIWGFVAIYGLMIAMGTGTLCILLPPILLSRWFEKYRGLAIGTAALGTQLGGLTLPPLVALAFEAYGWRMGLRGMGTILMAVVPTLVWLFLIERPSALGLYPDGSSTGRQPLHQTAKPTVAIPAPLIRHALCQREFWLVSFGLALLNGILGAVIVNLALFAIDIGITRDRASLLISTYALMGLIASPIIGRCCDLIDGRTMFASHFIVTVLALLLYLSADSFTALVAATAVIGIAGGGVSALWGTLLGKLYAAQIYARMMGLTSLVTLTFAAFAPLLSGWVFDVSGSYRLLFLGMVVFALLPIVYTPLLRMK